MPQSLTMIQIHKITPVPSVLVITLMSLAYLTSSNIIQLMNYVGFATWLAIGVAVFCVIFLRFKHPDWERPIKVGLNLCSNKTLVHYFNKAHGTNLTRTGMNFTYT